MAETPTPYRHRIVIVGGGAGGLELATRLGDRYGRRDRAEVTLPRSLEPEELDTRLQVVAKDIGVDCSLHPSEPDIL